MSQVRVSGNASGTGVLTIAAPNTNSNYTLTLPTATGTLVGTGDSGSVTQAMLATAVVPLGVGQTWTNVTASRANNTTYTNSTGRPIVCSAWAYGISGSVAIYGYVDGVYVTVLPTYNAGGSSYGAGITYIVNAGSTYKILFDYSGTPSITWYELR